MALEYGINFNTEAGLKQAQDEIKKWQKEFKGYLKANPLDIGFGAKSFGKDIAKSADGAKKSVKSINDEIKALREAFRGLELGDNMKEDGDTLIEMFLELKDKAGKYAGTIDAAAKSHRDLEPESLTDKIKELSSSWNKLTLAQREGNIGQTIIAEFIELQETAGLYAQSLAKVAAEQNAVTASESLKDQLNNLSQAWDKLTESQRRGAEGQGLIKEFSELRNSAGEFVGSLQEMADAYDRLNDMSAKGQLQNLEKQWESLSIEQRKGVEGRQILDNYRNITQEAGVHLGSIKDVLRSEEQRAEATKVQTKEIKKQSDAFNQLKSYAMNFLSVYAGIRMIKNLVDITGEFEMQAVSMKAILMDAEKGAAIFERIKELAVISPFQFKDLVSYAKQLSAFSVPYEELYDSTKMLADLSAGLGVGMDRLILAFGQVRAASVLRGQELRQFTEAGIPLVEELRRKFEELNGEAVTAGQVFEFISERKVPFEMVKDIIVELTSEGGKFYKMQEKQADTLKGKIANLKDAADIAMASLGEKDGGILKGTVDGVRWLIENYEILGRMLLAIATTYGVYKANLIATNIATAISTKYGVYDITTKKLQTAATWRLVRAKIAEAAAQTALGAAMLANPMGAFILAVVGLTSVMWALKDSTTAVERAQKQLNDENEKAVEAYNKERQRLKSLIENIKSETTTRRDKIKALNELKRLYPSIFSDMDIEAIKIMNVADAQREQNKLLEEKADLMKAESLSNIDKRLDDLRSTDGQIIGTSTAGSSVTINNSKEIATLEAKRLLILEGIKEEEIASRQASYDNLDLKEKIMVVEKENYHLSKKMANVDPLSSEYNRLEREMLSNNATLKELNDELNKPKRTMVEALKELDKWQKILIENQKKLAGGSEDKDSVTEAEERIDKIKNELALMGWNEPTKGETIDDTLKKYLENVTAQVNEYKERFNIYKAMTEKGGETDMDFEFTFNGEPNLSEFIKKQMKAIGGESLNLAIDFKTAKFEDLNLGDNLKEEEVAKLKSLFDELRKMSLAEFQDMDKLLSKYASYTKRRAELDRNYVKEKKELFDANADSSEVVEQLRVYREESDKLVMEFAKKDEAFNSFVTSIATQSVDRLRFMLMQLQAELVQSKVQGMDAESLVVLKAKIAALEEELKTAIKDVNQTKDVEDSYKSWKRLQSVLTKVNKTFDEIGNNIGGLAGEIISTAGDISTSTLQMVSGITMLANWSVQATKMTAEGAAKSIQTVEKASVILAIVGAALQILTKIASFFIKDTQIDPKVIEQYNSLISVTNEAIDAHKELLETLSGSDAKRQVLDSIKLIELQIDATRRMGKAWLNSGASSGFLGIGSKASEGVKVMENLSSYRKQLSSIGIAYDKLGKRGEGLLDLTAEQVKLMKEKAPEAWAALGKEVQGYLENIEEASKGLKDLMNAEKEALTGLSFDDLTSGLDEFLLSADSGFEAISESFEDYMIGAILRVVKNQYLNAAMEEWYADFAKAMDDGELTEAERTALEKSYREKLEEGKRQLDAAKEIAGIESDVSTNLKGIAKGVGAMTEDTALVLGGYLDSIRFRLFEYLDYMQSPEQTGTMALMVQSQYNMIFHLQQIEANTKVTADTNTEMLANLNKVISVDGTRGSFGITVNT